MEPLFNINQAAFILKVHPLTIRRYIKEGRLQAIKVGGNIRIKESQLQNFNKDFTPQAQTQKQSPKTKTSQTKIFTLDDPFLRIKGRGAAIKLSS